MHRPPRVVHGVVLLALLALMAVVTVTQKELELGTDLGVALSLPDEVGGYRGQTPFFCQDEQCRQSFTPVWSDTSETCPECGGERLSMSLAERRTLPQGTRIIRKRYTRAGYPSITASIVLAEREQRSIHRPQQCLPAQGYVIEDDRVLDIALARGAPLRVMHLDLRRRSRGASGPEPNRLSAYVYWFVGGSRETPYHLVRLFWTAWDRVVCGVAPRWAYLTVATNRRDESQEHIRRISKFIAELYPAFQPHIEEAEATSIRNPSRTR